MTSRGATVYKFVWNLAQICRPGHINSLAARQLVYRANDANEVKGGWEKRVLELGNGRSVAEIVEIIYWDEIKEGAWACDLGLWKSTFDQYVLRVIDELAAGGSIYLKQTAAAREKKDE